MARAQTVHSVPDRPSSAVADLLRPPGSDPYATPIDWSQVPPWQQTSFFGVRARGQTFVYVVDCSGSMADDARLARAKTELRRCIQAMRWPQRFLVIFYNDETLLMPGGTPQGADQTAKYRLYDWMSWIDADGGTDPRSALKFAVGVHPDAVFLLSDGEYPAGTVAAVARLNARKIPIHTIDMTAGGAGDQLKQIAKDSGGQYAARP